jgi:hypothetical protein
VADQVRGDDRIDGAGEGHHREVFEQHETDAPTDGWMGSVG